MDSTDLKLYKEKANGRMSDNQIVTGVVQNLFPHVTSSQRAAGYFDFYGAWWQVADDDDGTGVDPQLFQDFPTLSDDDYVLMFAMDDRDAIDDITGYATGNDTEEKYGTAMLTANITAGDTTFDVEVKNAAMASGNDAIFRDGDTIKVTDKTTATAVSGNEETHTIDGTPVVASDGVTITLTIADSGGFANGFTADGSVARCSSIYEPASDIEASATTAVVTSTAGTFDDSTYPIVLDHIGSVDEDWTLTFTDASHFRLDGDSLGTGVATGDITTDFTPTNSGRSKPYFTIEADAFGGTFEAGDTITFTTKPAAVHIGLKRVVPAGSGSLSNNKVPLALIVEAA